MVDAKLALTRPQWPANMGGGPRWRRRGARARSATPTISSWWKRRRSWRRLASWGTNRTTPYPGRCFLSGRWVTFAINIADCSMILVFIDWSCWFDTLSSHTYFCFSITRSSTARSSPITSSSFCSVDGRMDQASYRFFLNTTVYWTF